jgi:hypothetical protein
MACKQDSKAIGEHEFFVRQLPAKDSLVMQFKLVKILGGALATLGGKLKTAPNETEILGLIGAMLHEVTADQDPESLMKLVVDVVCMATGDGKRITPGGSNSDKTFSFNDLFAGDLTAIFEVAAFVIKVNYSDFIIGLLELGNKASPEEILKN